MPKAKDHTFQFHVDHTFHDFLPSPKIKPFPLPIQSFVIRHGLYRIGSGGLSIKPKKTRFFLKTDSIDFSCDKKNGKKTKKIGKILETRRNSGGLQIIHILYPGLFQMYVKKKIFIKNIGFFGVFQTVFGFYPEPPDPIVSYGNQSRPIVSFPRDSV